MRALAYVALLVCMTQAGVIGQAAQAPVRDPRAAAPASQGTALLAGQVVAVDTGQPLPGVQVRLSGASPAPSRAIATDAQGRFSFDALPAGTYTVTASRAGFVESAYGQKQPGSGRPGTPIDLRDAQQIKDLAVPLPKGGVITGVILDEFGFPAPGTTMRAYRRVFRNGERALQQAASGQTDDRGIYRIFGLLPGDYVVLAAPRTSALASMALVDARREAELAIVAERVAAERRAAVVAARPAETPAAVSGYAPIYYPGTAVASMATFIAVAVGEEKAGVDFALQVVPFAKITGFVAGVSPLPASLTVYLTERGPLSGLATRTTRAGPDGRFSLSGVPPGEYQITVRSALRPAVAAVETAPDQPRAMRIEAAPAQWMWAQTDLTIAGSDADLVLSLAPAMSVSGAVTFRGAAAPPDPSRVRMSFLPIGLSSSAAEMELGSASARVDADGRFTAVGLMPGRYRVTASAPGWSLVSVTAQGRDALDFPLEIRGGEDSAGLVATFTDRSTDLNGALQNAEGQPAAGYTIVAFADDSRYWQPLSRRIQALRPTSTGRFSFKALPPGDYRLAAVVDVEPGQWFDPEFLRQLVAASTPVTLGEGETRTQDLRIR